ncbi:T9SS type A sorting domain-containing protein [Pedobacter arcticus]|uniref:T9SS type A sorting domain-containing protein n=1 Tax=Pedobacter arcticus TaxID=752140 RepID=UPI0002F03EC3|nr:T9SS type A sorting domain-containing protein [Pedobacter arcticus]
MKTKLLLLLFITGTSFANAQGVWEKASTSWVYNLGAGTGNGTIDGSGYIGTVATTSAPPATVGFMPIPPSGKVKLSNKTTVDIGEGEWYLKNYLSKPALKFISSRSGRVAKFSMYEIANATQVASFFYKITFEENSSMTEMDWQYAIGRTNGASNQLNNENSGIPANPSTQSFPDFFATVRWQIPVASPANSNPEFRYCYKGSGGNGETAGTTYERVLNGITFSQGVSYDMEFYCNNSSEVQKYVRNTVTYTLPSNSMHIWANGTQLTASISGSSTANIPGYNLERDNKLDACVFVGQRTSISGSTKHSTSYIQNIEINHVQTPLPVSLRSFNGTSKGSSILLKWSTASEQNNAGFDVLKKTETSDFKVIGNVAGAGNSTEINTYSFTDFNPSSGPNYYQLKQIDNNGEFSLSNIVALSSSLENQELKIYLNSEGKLMASVFSKKLISSSTIIITDISGKILLNLNTPLQEGYNTLSLNVNNLVKGIYTASLVTSENKLSTKFIL